MDTLWMWCLEAFDMSEPSLSVDETRHRNHKNKAHCSQHQVLTRLRAHSYEYDIVMKIHRIPLVYQLTPVVEPRPELYPVLSSIWCQPR